MDFVNRARQATSQPESQDAAAGRNSSHGSHDGPGSKHRGEEGRFGNSGLTMLLLMSVVIVVVGTMFLTMFYRPFSEARHVQSDKYQAVFLEGNQVYFGKITRLVDDYIRLQDIYYLRVNQQVQPSSNQASGQNISLQKLGCELHGPQDAMILRQNKVVFWENLKDSGQVAKAIKQFQQANPNGMDCDTAGDATQGSNDDDAAEEEATNNEDAGDEEGATIPESDR